MKKIILIILCCAVTPELNAQKCLDINILSLMGGLQLSGSSATSYGKCETSKNSEGQTVIANYGTAYNNLESMMKKNMAAFSNASVSGAGAPGMPNASQVQDAKALAAKLQNMSPDERKVYAMQMAQQMQTSYSSSSAVQEKPATAMLVMKTQSLATTQLVPLDNEFAGKFRALADNEQKEKAAVKSPDYSKCPGVDKEGMPSCACVNGLAGAYWDKMIAIEDSYIQQKTTLFQSYVPRIKNLVGQIEDNIARLHYGDDVQTATYKRMLFSSQSTAFGAAFDISGAVMEDIQKSGSDDYVNKVNCGDLVYNLGCAHSGK